MKIQSIDHIQITATAGRIEEAIAFYHKVMGMTAIPKPEALAQNGGAWFELGDIQLHLSIEKPEGDEPGGSKRHICYVVDDLRAWRHHLQVHAIAIQETTPALPGCERLFIRDPAGNRIELVQKI